MKHENMKHEISCRCCNKLNEKSKTFLHKYMAKRTWFGHVLVKDDISVLLFIVRSHAL